MKTTKKEKELQEEIDYWNSIEKQIDNCPKENYKEFTKLEKLWMNCPIEILKAKLEILQERNAEVKQAINDIEFIMCLKDAEGNDKVSRRWREKIVIKREELLQKLGLEEKEVFEDD